MRHAANFRRLVLASSALAFAGGASPANAATCVWNGGAGDWSSAGAWSCGAVPGSGDAVFIDSQPGTSSLVSITSNQAASTLTLDSGDRLGITGAQLAMSAGSLTANGNLAIGANSYLLSSSGALALGGTGAITLDNSGGFARLGGNYLLYTIGAGLTVQGAGEVGFDQSYVSNAGRISANVAGGTLTIDPSSGSGGAGGAGGTGDAAASFVNTGAMQAANGGTLAFSSGRYDNTGGTVRALAGSTVALNNDVRLTGGTLATSGDGRILATNGTIYLTNATLANGGDLRVDASVGGASAFINTGFTNNGTVTIASGPNGNALFGAEGGVNANIGGTGTITLDNSGGNRALLGGDYQLLTLDAGQTVQGAGEVGFDATYVSNAGLISANVAGGTLTVDPYSGSGGAGNAGGAGDSAASFVNSGTMQAANGGTLAFSSGRYDNTGGGVQALAGSTVALNNDVRLTGGTLATAGAGRILATNGTIYLTNTTLASGGDLRLDASAGSESANINTAFTNNGAVTIASGANGYARLGAEGSVNANISGTGTITLDNSGGNRALLGGNYTVLTLGAGQTVQGQGEIGYDNTEIVNNGLISANVSGATLYVDPYSGSGGVNAIQIAPGADANAAWVNNGAMQATNGGTLRFYSGRYDNSNGAIRALAGSTVYLDNDVRIIGGALTSSGGGQLFSTNATTYLQNATLTNGTTLNLNASAGGVLSRINGALTNNGSVLITSGVNGDARLGLGEGNANLSGVGTITLNISGGHRALLGGDYQVLTIGAGQIVQGQGEIGFDNTYVVNNGLITANVSGGALYVDPYSGSGGVGGAQLTPTADANAAWVNNGTMQATNGGQLHISAGRYDNTNGTIQALAGSTVHLDNDVRIIGGALTSSGSGQLLSSNATTYPQNTMLTAGSNLLLTSSGGGVLSRINGTLTNNGAITVRSSANGDARIGLGEGNATLAGAGTVTLDNSGGDRALLGGDYQLLTIGAGQTVNGAGEIGFDQTYLVNNGVIRATAGTIAIDPYTGSGGVGGLALGGPDTAATLYNTGLIQAGDGGNALNLNSGRYEQAASGSFAAGTGSTFAMLNDANLVNLETGGVLDRGLYQSITTGATSLVDLRSAAASSIVQIGADRAGIDTTVTLFGANSVLEASPLNDGTPTTIDRSLTTISRSGQLQIGDGRVFAASNIVANAGVLSLSGGTFTQPGALASSGLVTGNGTVGVAITNTGSVIADGGVLNSQAISGLTGVVQSNAGATLNLAAAGGPSQAGMLVNNGALALGGNDILVRSDYQNANFGSGNAFNAHANVTGAGLILAESATQDLSGAGLNLTNDTLNVGNVRLGGTSSTTLTITNNGTLTTLRGAVESPVSNTVAISSSNFVVGPNGGSTDVTLSYTGTQAGSLSGNTLTVANNFDNVADQRLTITGAAYNPAAASLTPNPINLGATRVGGTLSGLVTIANTAPAGQYSESLAVTSATGANGATGTRPTGLVAAGSSATSTVSLNTGASGTLSGTVTYGLATDGAGTSGLAQAALPSQVETVTGKVYQLAAAQLGTNSVAFATVRQGAATPTASVSVTNGANGALNDSLSTSIGSLPTGVTGTAPGSLAGGQQGALSFAENTATAGAYSGTGQIDFQSTDPDLAPANLPSQNVSFSGTVTQIAVAQILKDFGVGTLTGSGTDYALDLGSFSGAGSASTDLGVANAISNFSYDETLGGTFGSTGGAGYTFNGQTFTGLTGGGTDMGNALSFNYSGLADGAYTDVLTFNGYSRYTGLTDLQLSPIRVTVTARVTGGIVPPPGAVPEPASWTMMLFGFGALGAMLRRRKAAALRLA